MEIKDNYLSVPRRLILELQDNLLALALYLLVCRLYLVLQRPVPFSRGDAARYDGSVKVGGFTRAIDRLLETGWLVVEAGYKHAYVPTWGRNRAGQPYLWTVGAERLGRPKHVETVRVERALLDLFLGRVIPGQRHTAVERYVTRPLLRLLEVGAYIAAADGYPVAEELARPLRRWGLLRSGAAHPVPDEQAILALVSQRGDPDGPRLTEAGWRRLGWPRVATPPADTASGPVPLLFFEDKARIGERFGILIGKRIGQTDADDPPISAPTRHETPVLLGTPTMTGIRRDSEESQDLLPQPPQATTPVTAGGCLSSHRHNYPDTATARLLAELGCYPSSIAELCELPVEQVGGAIAYARSQTNITDKAAWTVDALRRIRDGAWTLPQLATAATAGGRWSAERLAQIAGSHGDLMRLGSDTSDLEPADSAIGGVSNIRALERSTRDRVIGNKRYRVLRSGTGGGIPLGKMPAAEDSPAERSPAQHTANGVPTTLEQKVTLRKVVTSPHDAPQPSPSVGVDAEIRAKLGNKRFRVSHAGGRARIKTGKRYAKRVVLLRRGPNLYAKGNGVPTPAEQKVALREGVTSVPAAPRPEPPQKWGLCSNGTETLTGAPPCQQTFVTPGARSGDAPAEAPPQDSAGAWAYVLGRALRELLRARCDRSLHGTINRLALQLDADGQARLVCATLADRATATGALASVIATALAELGLPADLAIETQAPPPPARHRWAGDPRRQL
ncbi:MAG TPA: hypothetical protein VFS21_29745 [Roseiflexaceae bacterium]|nr:hypothetical protein [Roseiflexaceae bacterium]